MVRKRKIATDIRETLVYLDSNDEPVETSGYVVIDPKEPDFIYIHRNWRMSIGSLVETISIHKDRLVSRTGRDG